MINEAQIMEPIISDSPKEVKSAIVLDEVFAGYGSRNILSNISFKVKKGELWAIIGPSGAGKTTLFKVITGLLKPKHGTVEIDNQDLSKKGTRKLLRGKIGYIPQNLGLISSHDVKTNVLIGSLGRTPTLPSLFGMFSQQAHKETDEILEKLSISNLGSQPIKTLSGGEKRRIAIARAMLQKPEIIIADEFLSDLDVATASKVMNLMLDTQKQNDMTVVLIEHNLDSALMYADKILFLKHGKVKEIVEPQMAERKKLRGMFDD
ncbi:MAG: putative ABC transporter ATP-binding protein [Candidatus Heimdallarchaeota archaeon LC_2]|nr:MAG: putative ABC transporter ATP-binding protein [Candidatus Heimdallarchaeota archaeon LC_2]